MIKTLRYYKYLIYRYIVVVATNVKVYHHIKKREYVFLFEKK